MTEPLRKPAAQVGLRERKRRQTQRRIVEVAVRLFLEDGYDATTLDAIAAGADISRRTFFHYFDSKEAIVEAFESDVIGSFRAALVDTARDRKPLDAVEIALLQLISHYTSDEAMALDRLMRSTEALRARKRANYIRQEEALYAALKEKWPEPKRNPELRVVAMLGIGAMRLATDQWSEESGKRPLEHYVRKAFLNVRAQLA